MTDSQDLSSLTLKDLRQMAGEAQIKNRSKLAKQQLVDALTQLSQAKGAETVAAAGKPASEDKPAKKKKAARKTAKKPEAEPEVLSPEVLSPETIGAVTEPAVDEPTPISADDKAVEQSDTSDGDEDEGNGKKRRRRRRRRRGRRGDDADEQASDAPVDTKKADEATTEPKDTVEDAKDAKKESGDRADEPVDDKSKRHDKDRDGKKDERHKDRGDKSARTKQPPKPRLAGKQENLSSVLDRLKSFTAGILELCDPDTPTWAQARLSELLAATGVVPTPCTGQPHPKFHEVVGTLADTSVAKGEIAVIETPGFSLRGDRGDLFPLRVAKVRIAGDQDSDSTPEPATDEAAAEQDDAPTPAPADDEGTERAADEASAEEGGRNRRRRRSRRRRDEGDEAPAGDEQAAPADEAAPAETIDAAKDETPVAEAAAPVPAPAANDDDDDEDVGDVPEAEPKAPARSTKVVEADEAPQLPLQPLEAEELAARPKAEGFRPLGLHEQILADLADVGWAEPSPIQAAAIPVATTGKDMIGQAQTGTGKTGGFTLPILDRLYRTEGGTPTALILCPTRELARQVDVEVQRMAGKSGARSALIYGGVSMDGQFKALARHPHVVIGTPGRIIDHMRRKTLDLSKLQVVVMDEADQMLDIGFLPDIEYILKHTPPERQTMLFSATMPEEIKKLASRYMREPEHVHVAPERVTADKVDQKYIAVDRDKKTKLLAHFIESFEPPQLVVFCKTKSQTDRVAQVLKRKKLSAHAIHGDLPQGKREKTLQSFRDGTLQCLIATNVAARGLDIPSVSHVVNYDIPENPEEYVHRIGRTGRMGNKGIARTFVTPEDGQFVVEIEKHIGLLLEEEVVEGITATTTTEVKRDIAKMDVKGPRLLKPIAGGIRLGRRRR